MRFLCWNMNYHIEHHMYPMVPFNHLPALYARVKDQLSMSDLSYTVTLVRTLRAVYRQMRDQSTLKPIFCLNCSVLCAISESV
ncbi:MAG: fatty acid desaturase [Rhodobacteraceae bacterium]|nr:fatty acid desaturase [Paracoccaceae bacterium]